MVVVGRCRPGQDDAKEDFFNEVTDLINVIKMHEAQIY
jgi:hypothetical protein